MNDYTRFDDRRSETIPARDYTATFRVRRLRRSTKIADMKQCFVHQFSTPICDAFAAVNTKGEVILLYFLGNRDNAQVIAELESKGYGPEWNAEALSELTKQTAEYFSGTRKEFNLALSPEGTDFQQRVWQQL